MNELIINYQSQINNNHQEFEKESELISDTSILDENNTDDLLVYNTLKKRLEEISKSLAEVESFPEKKPFDNNEPIHFQCVCVLFVEPDFKAISSIKSQTFRITTSTKVYEIITAGLELWEHIENLGDYRLFLMENELLKPLNEGDVINHLFKANKTIVKSAKFLLAPKSYKTGLAEINIEDQGNNLIINQTINKNEKFDEFVTHFPGVTKYIEQKFTVLKEEEVGQNKNVHKKKKPFTWLNLAYYLVMTIMFILFFIFSFLAIAEIKDPFNNFVDYAVIKTMFMQNTSGGNIRTDILNKIQNILFNGNFHIFFKLVSMARFSFYQSNEKECNDDYTNFNKKTCYSPYYKNDENDSIYALGFEEIYRNKTNCTDCFVYSSKEYNFVGKKPKLLEDFLDDVFRGFQMQNYKVEGTSIKGTYGTYKGENCVDLFIPISLINYNTLDLILNYSEKLYLDFTQQYQKAVIVDFTLYSPISQKYYYIYLLYENSVSVETSKPKISIVPFYPDLKKTNNGKLIYVLDILRLIFVILLFIIRIKEIYEEIMENIELEKNHKLARSVPSIIFSAEFIIDLALFIIYISAFSLKMNNLYSKAEKIEVAVKSIDDLNYDQIGAFEYFNKANKYETVIMLECSLGICLLLRLFALLGKLTRFENFSKYIKLSLMRILPNYVFLLILFFFFSIFSEILFGPANPTYEEYASAFFSTIMFSIGHFQKGIFDPRNGNYQVVFTFLFFIIVIYFQLYSYFGIYLEAYRINSLKHGNNYEIRMLRRLKREEKDYTSKSGKDGMNVVSEENKILSTHY